MATLAGALMIFGLVVALVPNRGAPEEQRQRTRRIGFAMFFAGIAISLLFVN
jgi:hypothetical protein